jgi:hypothetical protein
MIDAIRTGDFEAIRRHLDTMPAAEQSDAGDRAIGVEVLRHGGPTLAEQLYQDGSTPSWPWGDIDPVVWAADHGASQLLEGVLFRNAVPHETLRQALAAARAWLDIDPETELRRRAGVGPDEAVTIERDRLILHDLLPQAQRIRLSAPDGRTSEVLLSHRSAITMLEVRLGLPITRDELLARALWSADLESPDWASAGREMRRRFSMEENVRWAIGRLADPDVGVRRFAAELMHYLILDGDGPDEPYAPAALAALHARIVVEPDSAAMDDLIGAYAGFRQVGEVLYELLPFAGDPRPDVRSRVASTLVNGADDPPPHVLGALLQLARDPDPTVGLVATAELVHGSLDTPALREVLATHLAGGNRRLRIEAAIGLAMRGDPAALAELRVLSSADGEGSHAQYGLEDVVRLLDLGPVAHKGTTSPRSWGEEA